MIILSSKQKRQLKSLAMTLPSNFQIGKREISANTVEMLDKALKAHELIKISVLKNVDSPLMEIALDCASATHSCVVQTIGRVFVLYRPNYEKPNHIVLVK